MPKITGIFCAFLFSALLLPSISLAGIWDFDPELPNYDPLWDRVKRLQDNHRDGENIDEMLSALHELESKYPGNLDVFLFLGKAYLLKASWSNGTDERKKFFLKAIEYAKAARFLEKDNLTALKILVVSLPNFADLDYSLKNHGTWIKKMTPLPTGRAIPELKNIPEWNRAIKAWDNRVNIDQAGFAVNIFKKISNKQPENGQAHIWASRGLYYIGYYYMADENEKLSQEYFNEGVEYGEKALALLPHSVPANYWYVLNFGRVIQNTNIFNKALNFKPLLNHTLFCSRENPLYFYFGPLLVLGSTITRGGWITKMVMKKTLSIKIEDVINGLDIAEILYPDYFFIPFCRAEILIGLDREKEAKIQLEKLLHRNPDISSLHSAENHIVKKLSKSLLDKIQ